MTQRSLFSGQMGHQPAENMQDPARQAQALIELAKAMRNTAARCRIWADRDPEKAGDYRLLGRELEQSAGEIERHCGSSR